MGLVAGGWWLVLVLVVGEVEIKNRADVAKKLANQLPGTGVSLESGACALPPGRCRVKRDNTRWNAMFLDADCPPVTLLDQFRDEPDLLKPAMRQQLEGHVTDCPDCRRHSRGERRKDRANWLALIATFLFSVSGLATVLLISFRHSDPDGLADETRRPPIPLAADLPPPPDYLGADNLAPVEELVPLEATFPSPTALTLD